MAPFGSFSIRLRLLAIIAAALLPVLALIVYGAERSRSRDLEVAAAGLQQTADLIAAQETLVVENARQLLTAMAVVPALTADDEAACIDYLEQVQATYDRYQAFIRYDPAGRATCRSGRLAERLDLTMRGVLAAARVEDGFVVGAYRSIWDQGVEVHLLPFAFPIRDELGTGVAILASALRLDWWNQAVEQARRADDVTVSLIGSKGTVLATEAHGHQPVGQRVPWWNAPGTDEGIFVADGELVARRLIEIGGPLVVTVSRPLQDILSETRHLFWVQLQVGLSVLLIGAVAAWTFGEVAIARRVRRLTELVRRLEAGDLKARTSEDLQAGEFGLLGTALDRMAEVLEEKVVGLSAREAQFRHQASHDALTALLNRRAFEAVVAGWLETAGSGPPGERLALLLIDLNRFKQVNDGFGHDVGDAVLVAVAGRLRHSVRSIDMVARLGGDEFAVAMHASEREAEATVRRIVDQLSLPIRVGAHTVEVGASAGLAFASGLTPTIETLLKAADAAMYRAKRGGRSTFLMSELLQARSRAVPRFKRAVE